MSRQKEQPITNMSLLLTEDCNLRCDYCFVSKHPNKSTPEMGYKAVDFLAQQTGERVKRLNFFGGEPTVEWDTLTDIIEYRNKKGLQDSVKFSMTTNMTLLNDARIDYLKKNDVALLASVDGPEHVQNIHRKTVKGGPSWHLVEAPMRRLAQEGLAEVARITFTSESVQYLAESVKYLLYDVGFSAVAPTPVTDGYEDFSDEMLREYDRQLTMLDEMFRDNLLAGKEPGMHYYQKCFRQLLRDEKMTSPCGAGKGYVGMDFRGYLYPCHRFTQWPEWRLGNIRDGITEPKVRKILTEWNCESCSPRCAKCNVKFCGGGCFASHYSRSGTTHKIDDAVCKVFRIQYKHAEKMFEEYKDHPNFRKLYSNLIKNSRAIERGILRPVHTWQDAKPQQKPDLEKRVARLEQDLKKATDLLHKTSNAVLELSDKIGGERTYD